MLIKILKIIGKVIGGILIGVGIAFLFGWLVMLLWNWLMPSIFGGLHAITFWQAWGLVLLSHILFKAGGHPGKHGPPFPPHHWKDHLKKKIEEEVKQD